jgi:hypothetical protein
VRRRHYHHLLSGEGIVQSSKMKIALVAGLLVRAASAADLSDTEARWLSAATPVLSHALAEKLPVDVVVQPQPTPGQSPLAMAFVDGRCKLVLSMRGNGAADIALRDVELSLRDAVIEAMAAHEIGHCWRHVQAMWNALPAGFSEVPAADDDAGSAEMARLRHDMRATRREEGFADLVGLAWTLKQRPQQYRRVHAWLTRQRERQDVPGSHHDTRAWVRLAADSAAFDVGTTPSLFQQAHALWQRGLTLD